jgi:hypothetical protein
MSAVLASEEALAIWKKEKIIVSEPCIIAWRLECPTSFSFLIFAIVDKHTW